MTDKTELESNVAQQLGKILAKQMMKDYVRFCEKNEIPINRKGDVVMLDPKVFAQIPEDEHTNPFDVDPESVDISGDPVIDRVLTWVRDTFPGARMDGIQQPDIPNWLVEPLRQSSPGVKVDPVQDILAQLQHLALNLIQVTELEKAGVRDGSLLPTRWTEDGHYIWRVNHPLTDLADEIAQVVRDFHERKAEEDRQDDHFGLCPVCHKSDGYLNIGKTHIGVCHAHKKAWPLGMNLFSSWEHETEEDWKRNAKILVEYEEGEGFTYPRPEPARPASENGLDVPF